MTITADFSGGEKTVTTEPLYQWDTGQKLALSGLPATSTDIQVHFANAAMPQAIVKATATENSLPTCDIPNEFLQYGSAAKARAWVFYRASDTEGYTVRTVLIPVTPRKRPNDYVSPEDPDSKGIVERAIELLEGYEDDLASKLDASAGSVGTENLADESITVEKVANDLATVINAKEVKSNKKTTLTGNESSNDFYPTTKAVADALSGKAPAATAFTFDDTTTTVTFNENNPKIIYLNATVDNEKGIVLTSADNAVQYFFGVSKSVKVRNKNGASMNVKPKFVYYDIRRKQSVSLIMYTHENDVDTQVLEVSMLDNGEPIELDADYTYSAAIVNRNTKALINDNISCELNDSGNVLIPIDNFHTLGAQDLLIELTITDGDGNQVIVTPFPLWIHVNASILDDAQVTPESLGTVPELLEEAQEALETVGDYDNLTHKPQINGHELVGDKSSDDLGLQGKLTAGENVTIDENGRISATGGTDDYEELTNKPQINGHELSGDQSGSDLGLQNKLTAGDNVTIENGVISASVPTIYKTGGLQFEPLDNIAFSSDDFSIRIISGLYNLLEINNSYFKCYLNVDYSYKYDFNRIHSSYWRCGAYLIYAWNILNLPTAFTDVNVNGFITIFNFIGGNGRTDIRAVIYETVSGKTKVFVQLVSLLIDENNPEYKFPVHSSEWIELSSTISSAAVNQNGNITFTMSDGSTVTTTGESVIGPQGPAGADGNDYVLTNQDKSDIADLVLAQLPTTQGVQYGNTSN